MLEEWWFKRNNNKEILFELKFLGYFIKMYCYKFFMIFLRGYLVLLLNRLVREDLLFFRLNYFVVEGFYFLKFFILIKIFFFVIL